MRAVILAGGKGTRLAPFTTVLPKPLLPIGDMTILEVVLRQLKSHGITRATMAVGYLAELMQAYFADGKRIGMPIDYSVEPSPLGTVGPLALIEGLDKEPFMMMNGDILTDLDYSELIAYHREHKAVVTIATYVRTVKVDFGVIDVNERGLLTEYTEKPTFDYRVSMGIYVFDPSILRHVKRGERLDFPDLIKLCLRQGLPVASYPFSGFWLDMGRPDDYGRAVEEFEARRDQFLPKESR